MSDISKETGTLFRYSLVGIINTLVGYAVFCLALFIFGFSPNYANALGYLIALVLAFFLNSVYVFSPVISLWRRILSFGVAFIIAFSMNQILLYVMVYSFYYPAQYSQIVSMIAYTAIFYILNRLFVFK